MDDETSTITGAAASVTPPVALLLLDVINDLEWPDGERLYPHFRRIAEPIARLVARAREAGVPVVYVNDNYGRWQSDFRRLVEHCVDDDVRGREIARLLQPGPDDYFVLKPQFSGFFSTTLATLLRHLQTRTVILTGVAGNMCVLFTAGDAYMRGFRLLVPADCVASNTTEENEAALGLLAGALRADVTPSPALDLAALVREASAHD